MSNTNVVIRDDIRIRQDDNGGLFWYCLAAVLIFMYWQWVLLILGVTAVVVIAWSIHRNRQADLAAWRARADRQLHGWLSGDPRATYGWENDHEGQIT